jgi:hypothetical protein
MADNTDNQERQLELLPGYRMSCETARILRFAANIFESPPDQPDFLYTSSAKSACPVARPPS